MAGIAFTYDVATLTGQARFYAGDTDGTGLNRAGGDRTRTDAEVLFLLTQNGNDARLAAAELLEARAAEYAQEAGRTQQGNLRQDYTARSSKCLEAARSLRTNTTEPVAFAGGEKVFTSGTTGGAAGTMDRW